MSYSHFAAHYDQLMADVDYESRTDYILRVLKTVNHYPSLLLDMACGTGNFSIPLAKRGIEVVGVDISPDMLLYAQQKSVGLDILYLCQPMNRLDLYGTVDTAICMMDSVNHVVDAAELKQGFERISLFMEKDGIFLFDVNTRYKHQYLLGDRTFVLEDEGLFCVWQNEYTHDMDRVDITLDFFVERNGLYHRQHEEFSERIYTGDELESIIEETGFTTLAVYDDMTLQPPTPRSERIIYIVRKRI